jgi:hypothetical protein
MEGVPYLNLIGTLRYHERTTRPDICFALARMSKYCSAYDLSHYDALKRIQGTVFKGYNQGYYNQPPTIVKAQRVPWFPEGRYQGDIKGGGGGSSGGLDTVGYGSRVLRRLQAS